MTADEIKKQARNLIDESNLLILEVANYKLKNNGRLSGRLINRINGAFLKEEELREEAKRMKYIK